MISVKFIALLIIFVCISLIGIMIGNSYKFRVKELQEFETIFHSFKNNIMFMKTPIAYALRESCTQKSVLSANLHMVADEIENGDFYNLVDCVKKVFENNKDRLYLNQSDLDMIYDFFNNIENNNLNSFENVFGVFTKRLEDQLREAIEFRNKNKKVYNTLGIGVGAIIVIFLI